jgi:ribosomal protein S18 acetylase RimI-like enzyme
MSSSPFIRPANVDDHLAVINLVNSSFFVHRHLDWRLPTDWLGKQPFWVKGEGAEIQAVLSCVPEPERIAWVRLFATSQPAHLDEDWTQLFQNCLEYFKTSPADILPAIGIREWFSELLTRHGFNYLQDIVVLEWNRILPALPETKPITIRPARMDDLEAICEIDAAAFEPIWHLPFSALRQAFETSAYTSVAVVDDLVIGYQLSTMSQSSAHLARLAVLPKFQHQKIGLNLAAEMVTHFSRGGIHAITVNTQNNNTASLAVYARLNFQPTGDHYPVFIYPLKPA